MSRPRTKTLALIIPDIEDLFLSEIYRGLADVARRAGYAVSILSSDREIKKERENIRSLGERAEQGAIIFPNWGRANAEANFRTQAAEVPLCAGQPLLPRHPNPLRDCRQLCRAPARRWSI